MLLSIIGNLLGDGDGQNTDGNDGGSDGGNDLMGGDLSGSTSDEGLMPGTNNSNAGDDDDILADGSNGGMGGMDDMDDMGGDDDLLSDDGGMDGMDMDGEMSLDGMDGGEGDDGPSSELESRVEEIENNVGSLSSTVNTVQSENEKISDSLEEIEEDIRKLLEVYEMVTQGVNPFVEGDSLSDSFEHGSGGGGAQGTGNFGDESLFDSDVEDEEDEEIDDDIANAEAEDFLDDGMDDTDDEEDLEFDDVGMDDEFDDMDEGGDDDFELDDGDDADTSSDSDSADGDLSFDELKSEYESGDANWDEGDADDGGADDAGEPEDPFAEADEEDADLGFDDGADEDAADDPFAEDAADTGTATAETEPAATVDDLEDESAGAAPAGDIAWDDGGRPYLESIPSEYDTQFVVMDWLDYLVSEAGLNGAARTIKFYESIRWVSSPVEAHLQTTLNGFGGGPDVEDPEPRSALGVNHKRSLWRISQIKTPEKERKPFDEWLAQEGLNGAAGDVPEADADVPEDDELSIDIEGPEDATDDLETDGADDADDEADADGDSGEELVYTAVDDVDEPATDGADASADDADTTAAADAYANESEQGADDESGGTTFEHVDIDRDETETDTNGAQKILIDESGSEDDANAASSADADRTRETAPDAATETDAVWTDSTNATVLRENRVDDDFTDNGQMIWVDSDVVLSEAGADLYNTGGYARGADAETAEQDGDDSLKPLFIPDEEGNLTIEPVQLLLVHDDETDRS
ncbi:FlaD/FlaE family flagellar protein [Halopiger xanaduensis]|uniref:Flagella accessory C family protein n=1 Tax=Halopiger xanaduensis (strain DSM 18323 / JCM 14033 / SH-6) TaxID=797210 RepID=F8DA60_HALXS|nr:FlaD/FlaE family flagellar protein [Halopiger xanaduensis]AEH38132.1 Flagella accessory C family protein [Halopiger xanaduensis SH-6]